MIGLRVLIGGERADSASQLASIVVGLGHEVVAAEIDIEQVAAATVRQRPDVALVALGDSSTHALRMIDEIASELACPVIVLLRAPNTEFVTDASKRGALAYVYDGADDASDGPDDASAWQSSIDSVLRRFAEFRRREGSFASRAPIELAQGILMERHSINEHAAHEMLRELSRTSGLELGDVAAGITAGRPILPSTDAPAAARRDE
jgi:AmiR/NasT family two-component response regulator